MAVDRYTKLVLTVIAVCLVWLSLGGPSFVKSVSAQQAVTGQSVILAGWVDSNGNLRRFANPPGTGAAEGPLPVFVMNR
jgi:hypothetical protein